jgi:hypothetical protein
MSYSSGPVYDPRAEKAYNGLLGWSIDPALATANTSISAAASLQLVKIPLPYTITLSNCYVDLTTAATSTLTNCYVAFYTSAGAVIGQTADQSANWDTGSPTGIETIAITGTPTATPRNSNDFIWAAIYCGTSAGTVMKFAATVATPSAAHLNIGTAAATSRMGTIAQVDNATAQPLVPANIVAANTLFFVGIS